MVIHAYREIYQSSAQALLGEAFDYAVNTCNINGTDFIKMFTASTVSSRMENGEPDYLAGKSGIEIVREIVSETTGKNIEAEPQTKFERSAEYWIGWAVACYQWKSGRKYREIFRAIPFENLEKMYFTLHEADISKFVEIADRRVREAYPETNLKRIRNAYGCSQSYLAAQSGVSLRSIQMYEQRNKNINKASAEKLLSISKVLGCSIEDLIEK